MQKGLIRKVEKLNSRGVRSRKCISTNFRTLRHFSVGRRASKPMFVLVLVSLRKQCIGLKKWRWSIRWTILSHHSQSKGIDSLIFRCLLQRLLVPWRRSSRTLTSRRESIWRSKRCKYSHIPMTVDQELSSDTKHVQEQKGAITLTLIAPPRDIDKTTLQQPQRVGALPWCHPGHQGTSVGPGKDTTEHRCLRGKAVGGPQHDPQCDKRAQPKDRHNCFQQRTWQRSRAQSSQHSRQDPATNRSLGIGGAKDYRKAQKRRRGPSGDAVKDEGRVLHYLCWADDLYAMIVAMNHLTRILENMTNAIERLGMRWKEKSLTIVAGPFTEYKPGDVVDNISNSGKRWIWRVVEGMEALGT